MYGSFSEESLAKYQEILGYLDNPSFAGEEETYDFTRCLRPDGSAFGTRGMCQAPNRVAPQQDVPEMSRKDFIAGGGLTAMQKGASSTQVVRRGMDARAKAFRSGGGVAAMNKRGLTRDEVIQEGARSRSEAFIAGGGKSSKSSIDETIRQGAQNMAKAYEAGGGKAASRGGERISETIAKGSANLKAAYEAGGGSHKWNNTPEGFGKIDVIALGKKNLKAAFEAGGGEAAARTEDKGKVIAKGKVALKEAAAAGGGDVAKGKKNLRDLTTTRSDFSYGGGNAALQKGIKEMEQKLGRKLKKEEIDKAKEEVRKIGSDALAYFFRLGGGRKAMTSGMTVDEVIEKGEKYVAGKKAKEERARKVRRQFDKEGQSV